MGSADLPEAAATHQQNSYTVSQQCVVFVFRHANLCTTGIRDVQSMAVRIYLWPDAVGSRPTRSTCTWLNFFSGYYLHYRLTVHVYFPSGAALTLSAPRADVGRTATTNETCCQDSLCGTHPGYAMPYNALNTALCWLTGTRGLSTSVDLSHNRGVPAITTSSTCNELSCASSVVSLHVRGASARSLKFTDVSAGGATAAVHYI
jgi:hypothetical protein